MPSEDFKKQFAIGQMGESLVAKWLRHKGNFVLPVYDIEVETGKGPRLFTPDSRLVAPDMFIFKSNGQMCAWGDAKTKTGFTPLRRRNRDGKTDIWQTGFDKHYFEEYWRVKEQTGWPVWLFFLQRGGQVKDSPSDSPSGLWGNEIAALKDTIDHEHPDPPPHHRPMYYWNIYDLKALATFEECEDSDKCISPHADEITWETKF